MFMVWAWMLSRWDLPLAVEEVQRFLRKFIETL